MSKLTEDNKFYNKEPANNDKVHVLVCIVPANTLNLVGNKIEEKIRDIREESSQLGENRKG